MYTCIYTYSYSRYMTHMHYITVMYDRWAASGSLLPLLLLALPLLADR